MPTFKFSKLVRDKIVDHQIAAGARPVYRQLDAVEHKKELIQKIIEEAQEIEHADPEDIASEIADVQQALDDLREKYDLTARDVAHAQQLKNEKNGAFKKGIFVEHVELDESDAWVKYYRNNADRYPEVG
jgi:predicted house-cleaning noncanonical NTP pyrophosphatase (MazG superfamily)